jgi:hypothetical protein
MGSETKRLVACYAARDLGRRGRRCGICHLQGGEDVAITCASVVGNDPPKRSSTVKPEQGDAHNFNMEVYTLNGNESGSEQGTGSRSEPSVSAS